MLQYCERRMERRIESAGRKKGVMYKGLAPFAFQYYFLNGGITPNPAFLAEEPSHRSITRDWKEAEQYQPLGHCYAVVKPREGVQESGDYVIPWEQVLKIFVNQENFRTILRYYKSTSPSISWENFKEKLCIIDDGRLPLRRGLSKLLHS